jgi:alpha-L-fucosidase
MATTTVGTSLLQALDVIQNLSAQVIFNLHIGQDGSQVEDLLVGQLADAAGWVDVEAGQEAGGGVSADAKKGLE